MFVAGPWLMTTMFGAEVAPYAWIVVPLGVVVPLRFLSHLFGMALTSTDAQGRRVFAVVLALGLVLSLDIVLIPWLGIAGAVIGSLAASLCVFVVYAVPVVRHAGEMGLVGIGFRYLLLVLAFGMIGTMLEPRLGPLATVALIGVAYAAVAFVARERGSTPRHEPGSG
jgi:O-antigen/teichoic acid export membrane protein